VSERTRQERPSDPASFADGCGRGDRRLSVPWKAPLPKSSRILALQSPHSRLSDPVCGRSIVRHAILRAGIEAPTTGAHQFRHGLATQMLRHGASLAQIGELLGHKSPETTKIYTKVDIEALRTLALPWPGGVR
jgi:integrase/recombinase XerD